MSPSEEAFCCRSACALYSALLPSSLLLVLHGSWDPERWALLLGVHVGWAAAVPNGPRAAGRREQFLAARCSQQVDASLAGSI